MTMTQNQFRLELMKELGANFCSLKPKYVKGLPPEWTIVIRSSQGHETIMRVSKQYFELVKEFDQLVYKIKNLWAPAIHEPDPDGCVITELKCEAVHKFCDFVHFTYGTSTNIIKIRDLFCSKLRAEAQQS